MRKSNIRGMAFSLFAVLISAFNFSNLADSDCIRAIHVINLLICGMAIGVFLTYLFAFFRNKKSESNAN